MTLNVLKHLVFSCKVCGTTCGLWDLLLYVIVIKCTSSFYVCSNPKDEASWLSVLFRTQQVSLWDSNPHSADQKHQSLNPVLLTTRPQHIMIRPGGTRTDKKHQSLSPVCLTTRPQHNVSRPGLEPTLCWSESPEFESGALNRRAMTRHSWLCTCKYTNDTNDLCSSRRHNQHSSDAGLLKGSGHYW